MGDACNPHNLTGVIYADKQRKGDIFSEAARIKDLTAPQRHAYEATMADTLGLKPKSAKKGSSALDAIKRGPTKQDIIDSKGPKDAAQKLKGAIRDIDYKMYGRASQTMAGKFYNQVDGVLQKWANGKDTSLESYKTATRPIRKLNQDLKAIIKNNQGKDLDKALKPLGLSKDNVYEAREWLTWLEKGGHLQGSGLGALDTAAKSVAKTMANLNMTWTMGNGADMMRVFSHYTSRKGGIKAIGKGLADAKKATNNQIWRKVPELEKAGLYQSDIYERQGVDWDPFSRSIIAQKNVTYYIDKAAGGDGLTGVRDLVFDSKPWDVPPWQRVRGANLIFGLARYPINESRWYIATAAKALRGDAREMGNLLLFTGARAAMFGAPAVVPSFLWGAMTDEQKEFVKSLPGDAVGQLSEQAFKAVGINAKIEMADYLQPFGGTLGARLSSIKNVSEGTLKNAGKTGINLAQGKLTEAGIRAMATGMGLANFGLLGVSAALAGKGQKAAVALEESPFNSTTITKLFNTTAKGLEEEYKADRFTRELAKAIFGQTNVKKADDDKGGNVRNIKPLKSLKGLKKLKSL